MGNSESRVTAEESLLEVVGKPSLPVLLDSAEAMLDLTLDEGLFKELPVIGIAARLYGIGRNLRERLFLKKLLAFLREVEQVKVEERESFVRTLEQDKKEAQRVGESLLHLLDRLGEAEKATLLGRFFAAYLRGKIDRRTFDQLGWALDRFFLQDIGGLRSLYDKYYPEPDAGPRIANAGLAAGSIIVPAGGSGLMVYAINSLGKAFMEQGGFV